MTQCWSGQLPCEDRGLPLSDCACLRKTNTYRVPPQSLCLNQGSAGAGERVQHQFARRV